MCGMKLFYYLIDYYREVIGVSYHCFCTIPWKTPQKKRKRSPLDGRGRDTGVYYKGYAKSYPKELTAKQHRIMTGELPLEEVRLNEIREIMKKAAFNEDQDLLEAATDLYNAKSNPNSHQPAYSVEEAKDILQSLTPWTIEWDKDGNT